MVTVEVKRKEKKSGKGEDGSEAKYKTASRCKQGPKANIQLGYDAN